MKLQRLFSLIGLGILAYMLNRIGFEKIGNALESLDIVYISGVLFTIAIVLALKGVKWRAALGIFNIRIGTLSAIRMWIIGFSLGAITPGRVGDFAKIFYLNEKKSRSMGAVLVDRLTDIFAVVIFAVLGVGVFGSAVGLTYEVVLLLGAALIFAIYFVKKHRHGVAEIFLSRFVPEKHRGLLRVALGEFYQSLRGASKNRAAILKVTALAIITWMISAFQGYFIAKSLGINISYFHMILILSISALLELIPVTVAGLGTREAGVVILMSFLGIESEKALVFSLTNFLFGYLGVAALGYVLCLRNPIKIDMEKEL